MAIYVHTNHQFLNLLKVRVGYNCISMSIQLQLQSLAKFAKLLLIIYEINRVISHLDLISNFNVSH